MKEATQLAWALILNSNISEHERLTINLARIDWLQFGCYAIHL